MRIFIWTTYAIILFCYCNLAAATTLILGTEDIEYYPHYGKSSAKSNQFEGFARALFDDFATKNNVTINYEPLPIKRLYFKLLVDKTIDFKYPDSPQWHKKQKAQSNSRLHYSQPIVSYLDGVFVHKDNKEIKRNDIKSLGIIRGFTPEPFINDISSKKMKTSEFSSTYNLLKALEEKRVNAIYINVDVAKYQIAQNSINDVEFNQKLPYVKGYYRISTLTHPDIIKLIDSYIVNNSNYIEKLKSTLEFTVLP